MSKYCVDYKKKTAGFGIIEDRRFLRGLEDAESRKLRRLTIYANNRRLVDRTKAQKGLLDAQPSQTDDRKVKLLKWKAEKELQKQLEKQKKQPVFRAGIPHHKYNSPIFLHQSLPIVKPANPSAAIPRITRATAKRIAARNNDNANSGPVPGAANNVKKTQKISKTTTKPKEAETSFAPENHKFKAPEGLPALKLFGPEALDGTTGEPAKLPVYFSPCVITSRGKRAWCKEQLRSIRDEEETSAETRITVTDQRIESSCPTTEEELTPSYFKLTTAKEVNRLQILCRHWEVVKNDDNVPEEAQLIINQAIGQTNLLISKKIEQFKKLIVDCETESGEKLVTCQDLQGFWDMVYMQVEDCDSRFAQLIKLQEKNWVEDQPEVTRKKIAVKKPVATKKAAPSKSSSVRDMIRAARRKLIESNKPENSTAVAVGKSSCVTPRNLSQLSTIKFDGGFFMVESPKKTVTPRNIRKLTLSEHPKNSGEARRRRSALNLMKVSQALKPVEIGSDSKMPSVNNYRQTPGRSILKHRDTCESTSRLKESQNRTDLVKDLDYSMIDSHLAEESIVMSKDEGHANIGRKLHFASDSDPESDEHTKSAETNDEEQHASSPVVNNSVSTKKASRKTHRGVLVEHNDKSCSESSKTKINESVTPETKKNSTVTESHKENETPRLDELTKPRRSTRKSVRFIGAECTGCAERTVYPMTPRANRKSRISAGSAKIGTPSTQLESDLISFDTPKDLPPRVRRSSRLQNNRSRHEDA